MLIPFPLLPLLERKPKPLDAHPSWAGWHHLMTQVCLKQAFALRTRPGLLLNLLSWKTAHPQRQPVLDCWLSCLRLQPVRFCCRRQRRAGSCSGKLVHSSIERLTTLPGAKAPYFLETCWAVSDICPWCTSRESWSPEHQIQLLFLSPRRGFTVLDQQLHHFDGFTTKWPPKRIQADSQQPSPSAMMQRSNKFGVQPRCHKPRASREVLHHLPTTPAPPWELHPSSRQDPANSSALLMRAAWQPEAKHRYLEVERFNNKPMAVLEESEKLLSSDLFERFSSSPTLRSFGDGKNVTSESLAWIKNYILHKLNI